MAVAVGNRLLRSTGTTMNFSDFRRRAVPFRNVLGFTFSYWRRQSRLAWAIAVAVIFSTLAEVLVPVYAGHLIDAIASSASDRNATLERAVQALGMMILLGAVM